MIKIVTSRGWKFRMVLGHFQADYKIAKKHWQDGWKPVVRSFGPTHEDQDQDQETKSFKARTVGLSPIENLANERRSTEWRPSNDWMVHSLE